MWAELDFSAKTVSDKFPENEITHAHTHAVTDIFYVQTSLNDFPTLMRLSLLDSAAQTHAHMQKLILQDFKAVMPTLSGACCRSLLLFSFPLSNIKPEKVFCMQVKLLRNRAVKQREVERGQKRKWMMHLMHNIYNNPKHGRIMWSSTTMMKSQGEAV